MKHDFSTAYCAWSNGVAERINRDLLAIIRTMIIDLKVNTTDWPTLAPLVQFGLNHSPAASLHNHSPSEIFTALPPSGPFTCVFDEPKEVFYDIKMSSEKFTKLFTDLLKRLSTLAEEVIGIKKKIHDRNRTELDITHYLFELWDYVLYSRVDRGSRPKKLYCIWTGPYQIVD